VAASVLTLHLTLHLTTLLLVVREGLSLHVLFKKKSKNKIKTKNALVNTLQKVATDTAVFDFTQAQIRDELTDLCDEFNLAPDEWVDVKRLPVTVVDLTTLKAHLISIRDTIATVVDAKKKE